MGKRDKSKKKNRHTRSNSYNVSAPLVCNLSLVYKNSTSDGFEFQSDSVDLIERNIVASLLSIRQRYLDDFKSRKSELMGSRKLWGAPTKYPRRAEKSFRTALQAQISTLWNCKRTEDLLEFFYSSAQDFVGELSAELKGLKDRSRLLRITCFNGAYYSLCNFSEEIAKIAGSFFKANSVLYPDLCKKLFYESVAVDLGELRGYNIANSENEYALEFKVVLANLLYHSSVADEGADSDHSSASDTLQKMPVEDLVEYINERKSAKNKRRRKNECSGIERGEETDGETEEFRRRIESVTPPEEKLQPWISSGYLDHLRKGLIRMTNNI